MSFFESNSAQKSRTLPIAALAATAGLLLFGSSCRAENSSGAASTNISQLTHEPHCRGTTLVKVYGGDEFLLVPKLDGSFENSNNVLTGLVFTDGAKVSTSTNVEGGFYESGAEYELQAPPSSPADFVEIQMYNFGNSTPNSVTKIPPGTPRIICPPSDLAREVDHFMHEYGNEPLVRAASQ